jgi:transposase
MPAGRPSEYNPQYADEILRLMASGLSLTAAAAELGFVKQTIYNWADKYPEIMDAIKLGQGKRTNFLERRLLSAESGPVVTSSIFALKNSAPDEWRDKQELEHTGKDGANLIPAADTNEIARRVAFLLASGVARTENGNGD